MAVLKQTEDDPGNVNTANDAMAQENARRQKAAELEQQRVANARARNTASPVQSQMPARARQVLNVAGQGVGAVGRGVAAYGQDLASAKPVDRQRLQRTTAKQGLQENLSPEEYQELQGSQADFRNRKYAGDVDRKILPSSKQTRKLGRAANQTFKDFTGINVGEGARRLKRRFSGNSFMDKLRNTPSKKNMTRTRQSKEELARFSQPQVMPRGQDGDDAFGGTPAYNPFGTYEQRLAGMYSKEPASASPKPESTITDPYYQQQMSPQAGFGPDLPTLDEKGNPKSTAPLTDDGKMNPAFVEEAQTARDVLEESNQGLSQQAQEQLQVPSSTQSTDWQGEIRDDGQATFGSSIVTEGSEESPAARAAREAEQKRQSNKPKTKQTKLGRNLKGHWLPGYGGSKNVAAVTNLERTKNVRQDLADKRKREQESMSGKQGTLDV